MAHQDTALDGEEFAHVRTDVEDEGPSRLDKTSTCEPTEKVSEDMEPQRFQQPIKPEAAERVWNSSAWPYTYPMVDGDPWEKLKSGVDNYDKGMCDVWNGELDTILIFTGLFSAIVIAFCIESFQALSQDPAETTNILLIAISHQLANSSSPVADLSMVANFSPNGHDVQINVLYFFSLTIALFISSACILGKQWIREYQRDLSVSACDAVRVRQARFDSLHAWKIPEFMATLPVMLLTALLLFFTGLLIQLWNVTEHTTAAVATVVVALACLMIIVTTVVPAVCSMQPRRTTFTPFRSPQSWIFFLAYRQIQKWTDKLFNLYKEAPKTLSSWSDFDLHFLKVESLSWFDHEISSVHRSLRWIREVLCNSRVMEISLCWCLHEKFHPELLIESEPQLVEYTLDQFIATDNLAASIQTYLPGYDLTQDLSHPMTRSQLELNIRALHHELARETEDWIDPWNMAIRLFTQLQHANAFVARPDQLEHYHVFQDQVAFIFDKLFSYMTPVESYNHEYCIISVSVLLQAQRCFSAPVSRQILQKVVQQRIPAWLELQKSAGLLCEFGLSACAEESGEHAIELMEVLDKVMMGWCREPKGIDNLDVARWTRIRTQFLKKFKDLPETYFEEVPGE